jgi:hypothetical protein
MATGKVKRGSRGGRNLLFWLLVLAGWALLFGAGLLGRAHRGESFWEGLASPFVSFDSGWLGRVALFAGGAAVLALACFQNRDEIAFSHSAGPCVMALVFAGLLIYLGGLQAPAAPDLARAVEAIGTAWPHASHLVPAAVWGVLTGIGLGLPRSASSFWRVAGGAVVVASLAVISTYATLATNLPPEMLLSRLSRPLGPGLPGVAAVLVALGGFAAAFPDRRSNALRYVGLALIACAVVGAFLLGIPSGEAAGGALWDSIVVLPEDWVAHGGLVTWGALIGVWGACLLYNRFGRV